MKTITISVPDEELKSLEAFLHQSNIRVIDESEEDAEVSVFEFESEEIQYYRSDDTLTMEELEKELEEEIWKLHHFAE
jgi:hypothetical protein